ncbi:MAG: hypothetical protein MUP14_09780 [Dehalococcoidia bacterium]|nr:hypothetical protein [Dehalococcoidia bacterium]
MTGAALSVAIAAIAITLFGVILQWLAYRATIEQAQKAAQNVAEMRTEIHGLVGELRGMTERMVEAQERQFNRMLDAFVTRPGAAAEVAERTGESAERLQQISDAMEVLKEEIRHAASADEVQHKLDELADRLEGVSASTAQAARLAEAAASVGPSGGTSLTRDAWSQLGEVSVQPLAAARGEPVAIVPVLLVPRSHVEFIRCTVSSPSGRKWTAELGPAEIRSQASHRFVFPDHFAGASAHEIGLYEVEVMLLGTLAGRGRPGPEIYRRQFVVEAVES